MTLRTIKHRRVEAKTDYGKRMKLLKSEKPRIVFRRTDRYAIAQYVVSDEAQDKIILGITSKALLRYGWPESATGSLKSIPASYLTGFLFGKKIQKEDLETPIVDFGMIRMKHKTKTFAFLKGLIDAGLEIECKDEAFPEEERLNGESLKHKVKVSEIKSKIEKAYQR